MLTNTFIHIPGIGEETERSIWKRGIYKWDDFLSEKPQNINIASHISQELVEQHIEHSQQQLEQRNAFFFSRSMNVSQFWRLFPEFKDDIAYIDIETTGLSRYSSAITTIALYDGREVKYYVQGQNLSNFIEDIDRYKLLVTYNGKCFDVPFIERSFGRRLPHVHIDLRYLLRSLNYKGGLKSCEKQMGIDRNELEGVDGYCAVLLWEEFVFNKNRKALETLLAYNIEDVINLETLMIKAYNMKLHQIPIPHKIALHESSIKPETPFKADTETIIKIKQILYR